MFGDKTRKKNRRLNAQEMELELLVCKAFKRPPRTYIDDKPFYPYVVPEPVVNFNLNYKI